MAARSLGACALLSVALVNAASAQARVDSLKPDAPVFRVGAIVVQALRPVATGGGSSALEVRLDSMRLHAAPTLEQVLRALPFVQVRTNARGEGYFSIRGSGFDAREVAVLVDGIPLSLGFDQRADLSVLPATGVRTLTLVRGVPSLLHGPNVLGGVVEVEIAGAGRYETSTPSAEAAVGVDHLGARTASASVSLPFRAGAVLHAGAAHRESDGFPLPRGVHEPAPFSSRDRRLNSDHELSDGFVAGRYDAAGGEWLAFSASAYSATRGTPAELAGANPRFWRYPEMKRLFSVLSIGTGSRPSPLGGKTELQTSFGYDRAHTELDGFTTRTYTTLADQEDSDDRNRSVRVLGRHTIAGRGDLTAAFTYADLQRDETLTPGKLSAYRQRIWSGAAEAGWNLPALPGLSSLRLTAGLAYDGSDTPESGDKPEVAPLNEWGTRAGITGVAANGDLLLHAGVGRRARFPSLRELYSGALNRFEPNPELGPETLTATEAGATARIGGAQLQAVAFHHQLDDAIVRTTTPPPARKVKRVNRDRIRTDGIELLASAPIGSLSVAFDATAQMVEASDPNTDQEFRAEYQPKLAGGVRVITPLLLGTRLDFSTRAVGSQYCLNTSGGYTRIAPSGRADAALSRRWSVRAGWVSALETSIAADNLSDSAVYDQCGLPQPGRVLRFRIALR